MNYEAFFLQQLGKLRREGRYHKLERQVGRFLRAKHHRAARCQRGGRLVSGTRAQERTHICMELSGDNGENGDGACARHCRSAG